MPSLSLEQLKNRAVWEKQDISLPTYDVGEMRRLTREHPIWIHFGPGNIFKVFIARLQHELLNSGDSDRGIVVADTYDSNTGDLLEKHTDLLALTVQLKPDGTQIKDVVASIAAVGKADVADEDPEDDEKLSMRRAFADPNLQMVSFTITEKGYSLKALDGSFSASAQNDMDEGPRKAVHTIGIVTSLLLDRFEAGGYPLAVVSMDNASHNGQTLMDSVTTIADAWVENGLAPQAFADWLRDDSKITFPWSMIDKITPRPSQNIEDQLTAAGVEGMQSVQTPRGSFVAPFVNAEVPEYLVIEDKFPNGRPPLEKAGVYFTDRDTVNKVETMKVTTCLNPLHTALAIYGCLLGHESIDAEMQDPELLALVNLVGRDEGMKVVVHPGIIDPEAFLDTVLNERFPNPYIPDTPQRIAMDTSQKVAVRYGETIKKYVADPDLDPAALTGIPLVLAGWLRYLLAVDDKMEAFEPSRDPLLETLHEELAAIKPGEPDTVTRDVLDPILRNQQLFGVDLVEAGLADKITDYLKALNGGEGAVRATLKKELNT